ncbi:MAG: site-specific DNA-methyltransferase [Flavobacteriales bacterium]|nr:site-specific DNA-methyltransferase [Flavobacteriales bacterium]
MSIPLVNMIKGDCMDFMRSKPNRHYDLAIVDPPYGININVNMGRRKGDKPSGYKKFAGEDKSIPSAEYFRELMRISKNQIVWGGNYMTEHLFPSPCWLVWDKGFSEEMSFAQVEMAWTSFKSSAKKFDRNPNQPGRIHPTQKPVQLYKWILMNYANKGDKILDTHGGSGSIALACHELGFDLDWIELDKEYYESAMKRFKEYTSQTRMF